MLKGAVPYMGGGRGTLSIAFPLLALIEQWGKKKKNKWQMNFVICWYSRTIKYNRKFIYCYPNILSSSVALYWDGISISAARANSASFLERSIFFDIISVKFTNCKSQKNTLVLNQTLTNNKSKDTSSKIEQNDIQIAMETCLEVIKGTSRDVIIKFSHHVPWPISNTN